MFRNLFHFALFFLSAFWLAGLSTPALAHRVRLFAFVSGSEIVADCRFSQKYPARGAILELYEAQSGQLVLKGKSDAAGNARLPLPPELLQHPQALRLVLKAGEGHQAEWQISAEELAGGKDRRANGPAGGEREKIPAASPGPGAHGENGSRRAPLCAASAGELESIVTRVLDARLEPLENMLAALQEKGPGVTEIVGGIGWIFGLFGLLCFFKSRKNTR